ncbi:recombinase family protein [Sphingomonas psychrotolerans]|uniref:recombinase family protein n=1 Tax=Sphingomonas psychrotolerans TaxID=1327635 RepID=UPI002D79075C|nr:recombinase family protein [Sphingomonas psychrotolerans]
MEKIVAELKAKGAFLRATEQPIDTSTPAGIAFLQMLGVFAQFETAIRRDRQMEGIAKAKAAGSTRAASLRCLSIRCAS